ncbi:MAG: LON peptidase substrate-binding domain-containing protein [Polymorphobacter sp.]
MSRGDEPLPTAVPVFPLTGALLLPRGLLPLNIFEPRYLAMVRDAMAATGAANRIIGIIQPRAGGDREQRSDGEPPPLFSVGCLGRIGDYRETEDGRILIALTGVSRFRVSAELDRTTLYRQVMADYHDFAEDRDEPDALAAAARAALEEVLRSYLDARSLSADWDAVKSADDESLVTTLASVCPFDPVEKQALLEAEDLADRAATLTALMTFAQGETRGEGDRPTLQ